MAPVKYHRNSDFHLDNLVIFNAKVTQKQGQNSMDSQGIAFNCKEGLA